MAILLADAGHHKHLLPLTFTRPVGALRPGILTIADAWWRMTELPVGYRTEPYLRNKFPEISGEVVREVDGGLLPTPELVGAVLDLQPGQVLVHDGRALAFCETGMGKASAVDWEQPPVFLQQRAFTGEVVRFTRPWHVFQHCGKAVVNDFALLTDGRRSGRISAYNTVIGDPDLIFLEEGAVVEASVLNATNGPIYIGKGAEVMEGCLIRGPFALGDHAQLKMGAKIYGPSAFGPACRVGGEVNNSVLFGWSNKGHDGFLGNSVLGEWCNLGADTNTSNLKNTYGEVKVWSYVHEALTGTGLQFCGLLMGDHAKSGINTMFNTGTVVGVAANIFGGDFPPKHVPSFVWGGKKHAASAAAPERAEMTLEGGMHFETYALEQAFTTARRVMERRHVPLTLNDEEILRHVFESTADQRN